MMFMEEAKDWERFFRKAPHVENLNNRPRDKITGRIASIEL